MINVFWQPSSSLAVFLLISPGWRILSKWFRDLEAANPQQWHRVERRL